MGRLDPASDAPHVRGLPYSDLEAADAPLIRPDGAPAPHPDDGQDVPAAADRSRLQRYLSAARWWRDELMACGILLAACAALVGLLLRFDGRPVPVFTLAGLWDSGGGGGGAGGGLGNRAEGGGSGGAGRQDGKKASGVELGALIIAVMTVVRVALKGVVESSVSQAAWVWVSEARHRRNLARASTAAAGEHGHRRRRRAAVTWLRRICCCFGHARRDKAELEDFKMFDDASRGLWGAMILIWEMKGRHTACLGAAIIILAHGFETFTQQMVTYEQRPMEYVNDTVRVAPAPPRSEVWDAYTKRGVGGRE